ncbi:MAG: winged helix-turn-helix transcriptional regulator [Euryarchaeota archaeon]|nr:winged helix-turn-helix transcriptional regulator [Euryarchaeota archaeon]
MTNFHDLTFQKKIYDLIAKNPMVYASKIAELIGMKLADVEYQLQLLEKTNFIVVVEEAGFKQYYIRDETSGIRDKRILKTRQKIYDLVATNPGLHVSKLAEMLGMARSTAEYYLRLMEKDELVVIVKKEGYRRYYLADASIGSQDKAVLALLRQEIPLKIVLFLLKHPNARHKDILTNLNITSPLLSYYLNKLVNQGIIDIPASGEGFCISNRDEVIAFLQRYHFQTVVDRFTATWDDFY